MTQVLLLGIGNILLQDEGVGVHVVQQVTQHYTLPENVLALDGGTMGLELLPYLDDADQLLIIDAVDAARPPGTIVTLVDDEIPAVLHHKLSPHHVGLADVLAVARMRGTLPEQVVLVGVQPASLDVGMTLSPTIQARLPAILQAVADQMAAWGVPLEQ